MKRKLALLRPYRNCLFTPMADCHLKLTWLYFNTIFFTLMTQYFSPLKMCCLDEDNEKTYVLNWELTVQDFLYTCMCVGVWFSVQAVLFEFLSQRVCLYHEPTLSLRQSVLMCCKPYLICTSTPHISTLLTTALSIHASYRETHLINKTSLYIPPNVTDATRENCPVHPSIP